MSVRTRSAQDNAVKVIVWIRNTRIQPIHVQALSGNVKHRLAIDEYRAR